MAEKQEEVIVVVGAVQEAGHLEVPDLLEELDSNLAAVEDIMAVLVVPGVVEARECLMIVVTVEVEAKVELMVVEVLLKIIIAEVQY